MRIIVITFHYIRPNFDQPFPAIFGRTPAQFDQQLQSLAKLGAFISLQQLRSAIESGTSLPEKAFLITFDDGLREQFDFALPILDRLGIPAGFFVNTASILLSNVLQVHKLHLLRAYVDPKTLQEQLTHYAEQYQISLQGKFSPEQAAAQYRYDPPEVAQLKFMLNFTLDFRQRERLAESCFREFFDDEAQISQNLYMDQDMLRSLADRGYLGTHTHQHFPLATLTDTEVHTEIGQSVRLLNEWTGQQVFAISYPYGGSEAYNERVGQIASQQGFVFGFTTHRAANAHFDNALALSRFDTNEMPGGKSALYSELELFEQVNL
jgi:peptidoglycan/xylan/chitin deacetylase (PgdA/CDA1 family)